MWPTLPWPVIKATVSRMCTTIHAQVCCLSLSVMRFVQCVQSASQAASLDLYIGVSSSTARNEKKGALLTPTGSMTGCEIHCQSTGESADIATLPKCPAKGGVEITPF